MHGHGLRRYEGFTEFLTEIVDSGELTGAALDITKQLLAKGIASPPAAKASLSRNQWWTFEKYVLRIYVRENCRNDCPLLWPEMFAAYKNDGLCGKCSSSKPKNDQPISQSH